MSASKKVLPKRANNFNCDDVDALIKIWGSYFVQGKFKTCIKHDVIWQEIAVDFNKESDVNAPVRTWEELKIKVGNLKTEFTKEKTKLKSGSSPSTWRFYDGMNAILGTTDYHNDSLVMDSLHVAKPPMELGNLEDSNSMEMCMASTSSGSEGSVAGEPSGTCGTEGTPGKTGQLTIMQYRRRKAPNTQLLQDLLDSEKKMLALMEKRAKLDADAGDREARLLELEEAAQKREERLSQVQERALLAMESFFIAQTSGVRNVSASAKVLPAKPLCISGSTSSSAPGTSAASADFRQLPGVRRQGEAIVLTKDVLEALAKRMS